MGSLVWKPADDALIEVARVTVANARVYTFEPGIPVQIPPEDYANVKALLQAEQGTMPAPAAPGVAVVGTAGTTTYTYRIAAVGQTGDTQESATASVTTGNATLNGSNFNRITAPALPAHATGWRVIRTAGGATQGDISGVLPASTTTFSDTGLVAAAYTPAGAAPSVDLVVSGPPEM